MRFVCLATLAFLSGCGHPADTGLIPVTGEVFWQSQPAAGALVVFHPAAARNDAEWPYGFPHAFVGDDGSFTIGLPPVGEGAPPGDYKVLVTWLQPLPDADPTNTEPETFDRLEGRWATPERTTLTASVHAPSTQLPRFEVN